MYKHMKPMGFWKCRACGTVWRGEKLYQDPQSIILKWTCGNLFCGATVDPLAPEEVEVALNAAKTRA